MGHIYQIYQVECDGHIIHKGNDSDVRNHVISGSLKNEINKSGTFTFTVMPDNYTHAAGFIKMLKSIIEVYSITYEVVDQGGIGTISVKSKKLVWRGRVLDKSKDFYNKVTYNCEGMLGVLNDTIALPPIVGSQNIVINNGDINVEEQSATESDILETDEDTTHIHWSPNEMLYHLIEQFHNAHVDNDKKFTLHTVDWNFSYPEYPHGVWAGFPEPNYETVFEYIQTNFIDNEFVGGRFILDGNDLYYYPDYDTNGLSTNQSSYMSGTSTQQIEFGNNLFELTESMDASEVYTCLWVEANGNRTHVEYAPLVNEYGKIWKRIDISQGSENKEVDFNYLIQEGNKILSSLPVHLPPVIQVTALDLSTIDSSIDMFRAGMIVVVHSVPHNISAPYLCESVEIDICNPANSKISLGGTAKTLTPVASNKFSKYKDPWVRSLDGKVLTKGTIRFVTV